MFKLEIRLNEKKMLEDGLYIPSKVYERIDKPFI